MECSVSGREGRRGVEKRRSYLARPSSRKENRNDMGELQCLGIEQARGSVLQLL